MTIKLIIPLLNVKIDIPNKSPFVDYFKLIPNRLAAGDLFTDKSFSSAIGRINCATLDRSPCLYTAGSEMIFPEPLSVLGINSRYKALIFAHSLWFIKDNSITVKNCFIANDDGELTESGNLFFSNASGLIENTTVSSEELTQWLNLYKGIGRLLMLSPEVADDESNGNSRETSNEYYHITTSLNRSHHKDFTRIQRALLFLLTARSSSYLLQKISNYMFIFEALFSSEADRAEVTHKVAERTAKFLGGTPEEMFETFRAIKESYSIRSTFLHGQAVKSHPQFLIETSIKIDSIVRKILLKSFQHEDLFSDRRAFEEYFTKIIFN